MNCKSCRWFNAETRKPGDAIKGGECRRRAPRLAGPGIYAQQDGAPFAYWPVVSVGHWCGEFKTRRM